MSLPFEQLRAAKLQNTGVSARMVCKFLNETMKKQEDVASTPICDPDYESEKLKLPEIVARIIADKSDANSFNLDALSVPHTTTEVTKTLDDPNRPLKDIATELVVNEFFKTEDTLFHFMSFVYKMFDEALRLYRLKRNIAARDMFFVYKGGNILRLVSKEFLLELPASATRQITEFYAPFFKRSDSDFSIYIHPELKNYDTIYHEATLLAYLLQDHIRDWFMRHLTYYFDIFRYSSDFQRQVLKPYLEKFNAVETFANQFEDVKIGSAVAIGKKEFCYSANADVTLRFIDTEEDWLKESRTAAVAEIRNAGQSLMTITHNSTLDFPGGSTAARQRFNLTRTKFIFTLLKKDGATQNVGGELIDVSVPHKLDPKTAHLFAHLTEDVSRYVLQSNLCSLTFRAPSLHYMTLDLEDVLFVQRKYPWDDRKYVKRLNRLFYMYFINIFVELDNGQEKLQVLQDLKTMFTMLIDASENQESALERFAKKYDNLNVNSLIARLQNLVAKLASEKGENISAFNENALAFNEMIKTLLNNAEFTFNSVKKIRQYCSIDGRVTRDAIGNAKIHDFV